MKHSDYLNMKPVADFYKKNLSFQANFYSNAKITIYKELQSIKIGAERYLSILSPLFSNLWASHVKSVIFNVFILYSLIHNQKTKQHNFEALKTEFLFYFIFLLSFMSTVT